MCEVAGVVHERALISQKIGNVNPNRSTKVNDRNLTASDHSANSVLAHLKDLAEFFNTRYRLHFAPSLDIVV